MHVVVGVLVAVLGLWATIYGFITVRRGLRTGPWPSVSGRVAASTVRVGRRVQPLGIGGQRLYDFAVIYSYQARGRAWQGHRIRFGEYGLGSYANVQALNERYCEGAGVTVYYDPEDPSQAVLEQGVGSDAWVGLGVGAVLLVAGITIVVHAVR